MFIVLYIACGILSLSAASAEEAGKPEDLLRFRNGDSLHGAFLGLSEGDLRWRHSEARDTITLKTQKLRRLSFHGGRSRKSLRSPSYIQLTDGDRIPGTLISLNAENLVMETEFAGNVSIPREFVSQISPRPHGGLVHYIGPFKDDDWTVIEPPEKKKEENEPAKEREEEEKQPAKENQPAKEQQEEEKSAPPWVFSGGAYYSNSQLPIAIDTKSPDQVRIRFTLAWRNRLNAAIAFHATMKQPEAPPEKGEDDEKEKKPIAKPDGAGTKGFAYTYGHSYVLTIYSNYAQIYRCDFTDEGEADMDRLSNSSANLRLEEAGQAEFELRCDRLTDTIALFADGRFVSQWNDRQGYVGTGSYLAFASQNSAARLRISDVVVTAWNGMIDSAQSMETEDRDVILLTNGTDRFSGKLASLQDGKFLIKGTYADMTVPHEQVQEIRLAKAKQTGEDEEETSRQRIRLLLQPYGRLTMRPVEASSDRLRAHHPALGDLTLDLRYAGLMEFSFGPSVLDSWDDDY
jgi:hypothetical protein